MQTRIKPFDECGPDFVTSMSMQELSGKHSCAQWRYHQSLNNHISSAISHLCKLWTWVGKQGQIVSLLCLLHTRLNKWPETPMRRLMRSRFGTQARDVVWLLCVWGGGEVWRWLVGIGEHFLMLLFEHNVARGETVVR